MVGLLNDWEKVWEDEIDYDNDANDYYVEWYDLKKESLTKLFEKYFKEGDKVIVKVKKGALFIALKKS